MLDNGGVLKVIASPHMSKDDVEFIKNNNANYEEIVEKNMLKELDDIREDFIRDHIFALGWMLANSRLEIKIAMIYDEDSNPLSDKDLYSRGIFPLPARIDIV